MHCSISKKESAVLALLMQERELYGLQLVELSNGELKRGTIYVTLGRMEEKGLVSSRREEATPPGGGLPRRLYQLTALGKAMSAAQDRIIRQLREVPV